MSQVQCPHCGSNDVSKSTVGQATTVAKQVGNVAFAIGGKVIGEYAGVSLVGKGVSCAGKWALSFTPIEFVCNTCDTLFDTTFDTEGEIREITLKKTPMPEEIIEKLREEYILTTKKKRPYLSAVIFSFLTLECFSCFLVGISNDAFQTFCGIIMGIIVIIPTIIKWSKIVSLNKEIADCKRQSLREFKHLHKNLFSQYKQFN